jgi:hypothetical protein
MHAAGLLTPGQPARRSSRFKAWIHAALPACYVVVGSTDQAHPGVLSLGLSLEALSVPPIFCDEIAVGLVALGV